MSEPINNGGPAFPLTSNWQDKSLNGMTLRDYFAAKAMQGMLSDPGFDAKAEKVAECAYAISDAMLKAREA